MVDGTRKDRLDYIVQAVGEYGCLYQSVMAGIVRKWGLREQTAKQYIEELVRCGRLWSDGSKLYSKNKYKKLED